MPLYRIYSARGGSPIAAKRAKNAKEAAWSFCEKERMTIKYFEVNPSEHSASFRTTQIGCPGYEVEAVNEKYQR